LKFVKQLEAGLKVKLIVFNR